MRLRTYIVQDARDLRGVSNNGRNRGRREIRGAKPKEESPFRAFRNMPLLTAEDGALFLPFAFPEQ